MNQQDSERRDATNADSPSLFGPVAVAAGTLVTMLLVAWLSYGQSLFVPGWRGAYLIGFFFTAISLGYNVYLHRQMEATEGAIEIAEDAEEKTQAFREELGELRGVLMPFIVAVREGCDPEDLVKAIKATKTLTPLLVAVEKDEVDLHDLVARLKREMDETLEHERQRVGAQEGKGHDQ